MFHVKHPLRNGRRFRQSSGLMTTNRFGSSPREPLWTPSMPVTASWMIFRSRASIGSSSCSWPVASARSFLKPAGPALPVILDVDEDPDTLIEAPSNDVAGEFLDRIERLAVLAD